MAGIVWQSRRERAAKYSAQSSGAFGVLVGARQDVVAGFVAVADSPLVGYGSRFEGAQAVEIQNRASAILTRAGYSSRTWDAEYIPSHSGVVGSWVAAGIGALPFWIAVVTLAVSSLTVSFRIDAPWRALAAFLAVDLLWNAAFSPFGGPGRTLVPIALITLIMVVGLRPGLPAIAVSP